MSPYPLPPRRGDLLALPGTNRSLVFDKGIATYDTDWQLGGERKGKFLSDFAGGPSPSLSELAARRHQSLTTIGARAVELVTQTRLVIGLGLPQPVETGFLFDRLTGCPYLPGSSVKGLLRQAAARLAGGEGGEGGEWAGMAGEGEAEAARFWREHRERLFGPALEAEVEAAKGQLVVYDAFPTAWPTLEVDVLTPHQQGYYGGEEGAVPADWNDPVPVPFLTVAAGTPFRFYLRSRGGEKAVEDLDRAEHLLRWALDGLGIGAKTAAGYGMFGDAAPAQPKRLEVRLTPSPRKPSEPPQRPERPKAPPQKTTETVWENVEICWQGGEPAAVRGKRVAEGSRDIFGRDLLKALKKHKSLRGDVVVVKVGGRYRVTGVRSWQR